MKKIILILCFIVVVIKGCNLEIPKEALNPRYTYSYQAMYRKNSATAKDTTDRKWILFQRTVAAYARSIKASGMQCNLTAEEMAYCFSRKMFGNIYEGSAIKMRNGDEWNFFVSGSCARRGECRIVITSLGKNYAIDLYVDKSGYITTDNPALWR